MKERILVLEEPDILVHTLSLSYKIVVMKLLL